MISADLVEDRVLHDVMPNRDPKERLMELLKRKDEIDKEIAAAGEVLEREKKVGMHGPLVDEQDFPRGDINVPAVRLARQTIIRLQNDRKRVMEDIEAGLEEIHAASRDEGAASTPSSSPKPVDRRPFAFVKSVEPESPAFIAGIKPDDELLEVGSVNHENFTSLLDVKRVIDSSENKRVRVLLQRWEGGKKKLVLAGLVPKRWMGDGLVGCAVFPMDKK